MAFLHSLDRIREIILDPFNKARRGYQGQAIVSLDDLRELWEDWQRLDRAARERFYEEQKRVPPRKMLEGDL